MMISTSQWDKVTLGDIAQCLTVATKNPLSEGFNRYVGLEHIEPGNIHITSWGDVADGTTFTRVFRKGQVLFGKRRAYQKKAALAEFEGVCSGDILVCEAIDGAVIPELLPFIVQSDRFFDYAIKTSAGSLSPRTKFKDLAKFTLRLPTKKGDQKRIADLLWGIDGTIEAHRVLRESLELYSSAIFSEGMKSDKSRKATIGNLIESIKYGLSEKLHQKAKYPVLRMNNLSAGKIDIQDLKYVDLSKGVADKYLLKENDILFNRTNSFDLVGKTSIFKEKGEYLYASYLLRLRVKKEIIEPDYLNYYMNSSLGIFNIRKHRTPGVSQSNINAKNLLKVEVSICSMSEQKRIIKLMNEIEKLKCEIEKQIFKSKTITNSFINKMMDS